MAKRAKTEAPKLPVPQSDVEAAEAIAKIGDLMRELERIKSEAEDRAAAIAASLAAEAAPLKRELKAATEGLRTYMDANRGRLTDGCKVKHAKFPTGNAGWRDRPAGVTLKARAEEIIASIKTLGLLQFIRTKEEVDKEAMLKQQALAKTIAGISIASAGEDFYVEPLQMKMAEAVS